MIDAAWNEVLGELQQRLATAEAGLATGLLDVTPFSPPDGLGPMPAAYEQWATALLLRTRALEAATQELLGNVGRQLASSRRQPPAAAPSRPAFFDSAL